MPRRTPQMFILVAMSVLGASGASAADLVSNGEFTTGISEWRPVGRGSLAHSADGANAPGALEIEGGLAGNATQAVGGQCLSPVLPGQALEFGASVRVVSGSPAYCRVALFESAGADCRWIALGSEIRRTTVSGGWEPVTGGRLTAAAATGSVELRLHCANADGNTTALQVRFDDVVVSTSPGSDLIFADDFETGNTSEWSSVVP